MVLYGYRTPAEQFELYEKGRVLVNGVWAISNPRAVVTYLDGYTKKSNHNTIPSIAIDVVPYYAYHKHIRYDDTNRMYYFNGYVMGKASTMGIKLRCGADWDRDTEVSDETFIDLPHFELINALKTYVVPGAPAPVVAP